jgi:hypothetical protein
MFTISHNYHNCSILVTVAVWRFFKHGWAPAGSQLSEVLQICQRSFSTVISINLGNLERFQDVPRGGQPERPNTWWQMTKIDELTRIVSVRILESEFRNANHVAFHIGPGKAQSKARELHRGALSYAVATLWHGPALLHQRLWQSLLMVRRCTQSGPERVTDSEQMLAKCGHEHKHNTTLPRQKTMLTTCRNVHCKCAFISFELPRV